MLAAISAIREAITLFIATSIDVADPGFVSCPDGFKSSHSSLAGADLAKILTGFGML